MTGSERRHPAALPASLAPGVQAPPGASTARRPRWLDALVLMACQSSQSLVLGGVALFLPLIRHQLHLSFAQAGTLDAASTLHTPRMGRFRPGCSPTAWARDACSSPV